MIWIALTVAFVAVAVLSYAVGKYWLGWHAFKAHLGTIEWSVAFKVDRWHWRICANAWFDGAPEFHFNSTGIELGLGPWFFRAMGKDTN